MIDRVKNAMDRASNAGVFRMQTWMIVAALTGIGLALVAPHQLGIVLAKVNLVALGAWLGYWIDRVLFQDRISMFSSQEDRTRRALVVVGTMIAVALAL